MEERSIRVCLAVAETLEGAWGFFLAAVGLAIVWKVFGP